MDGVEAVACDRDSDFQEVFEDRCPHIQPVFDYFNRVKNFNDKVLSDIRKDEQRMLHEEGDHKGADHKGADSLKRSRYIFTSSRKTPQRKDGEAEEGKILSKGSTLFLARRRLSGSQVMKTNTMNFLAKTGFSSPWS